jgi:hypothetical protein
MSGSNISWSVDDFGRIVPTINVFGRQLRVQAPLNQANPNTTYVSPNTPQPTVAVPVVGQTDTQSGQPIHATYNMPPAPETKTAAQTYRLQHGLATSDDTDALNAESLAAAQAGRTYFNPTLAAQYGQPLPAGVSGPRTDVVNALTLPPSATGSVAAAQPTALSTAPSVQTQPTQVPQNLWPTMVARNLLRGIY